MNKSRLLVMLVALDVLLSFATVGADAFFGWTLPQELSDYRHHRFGAFSITSAWDAFHLLLLAVTALSAFAAWVGLVCFWRPARRLYLFALIMALVLVLVSGPSVTTSVGAMFRALNALVGGAILGLVYFSDLAHRFERSPVPSPAPAGIHLGTDRA